MEGAASEVFLSLALEECGAALITMSIAALNWAMDQKTDGPSAQSVLFVIADRANERGICLHADPDTIAEKTRQSRATVFRRLEEAERVGIVTRFVRHMPDGRREYEVRLAMQRYVNFRVDKHRNITLYDLDDDKCEGDPIAVVPFNGAASQDIEGESQFETQGESQIETQQVSPVRQGESHCCDPHKTPSKNPKEDSPLTPQGGSSEANSRDQNEVGEAEQPTGQACDPEWEEFKREFERDGSPILRVSICVTLFAPLTTPERLLLTKAAKGLIIQRSREKKPGMKPSGQTFIREIDAWPAFAKLAPPEPPPPKPKVNIAPGTPEFVALALARTIARLPEFTPQCQSVSFVGAVPLGTEGLAELVCFKPDTYEVDKTDWTIAAKGSPRYVAFCERVKEWIGFWPEPHRYWLDKEDNIVASHTLAYREPGRLPKSVDGLLMPPLEWPPPKHGEPTAATATGPPTQPTESLMDEEDYADMAGE